MLPAFDHATLAGCLQAAYYHIVAKPDILVFPYLPRCYINEQCTTIHPPLLHRNYNVRLVWRVKTTPRARESCTWSSRCALVAFPPCICASCRHASTRHRDRRGVMTRTESRPISTRLTCALPPLRNPSDALTAQTAESPSKTPRFARRRLSGTMAETHPLRHCDDVVGGRLGLITLWEKSHFPIINAL